MNSLAVPYCLNTLLHLAFTYKPNSSQFGNCTQHKVESPLLAAGLKQEADSRCTDTGISTQRIVIKFSAGSFRTLILMLISPQFPARHSFLLLIMRLEDAAFQECCACALIAGRQRTWANSTVASCTSLCLCRILWIGVLKLSPCGHCFASAVVLVTITVIAAGLRAAVRQPRGRSRHLILGGER